MNSINKKIILSCPCAVANIKGSEKYPELKGTVSFISANYGTLVVAEIYNLPSKSGVFAMHIHNGSSCTGNENDSFADAGTHLNFNQSDHPFHTGDLPALFNNDGFAWNSFYTNRFKPMQIKGYTVIVHANPDDYHTQPSGNAGEKIACGIIK